MTGTFSAYTNYFGGFVNLIHISQQSMIYPGLSTLTCVLHKLPVCGKEAHAGKKR